MQAGIASKQVADPDNMAFARTVIDSSTHQLPVPSRMGDEIDWPLVLVDVGADKDCQLRIPTLHTDCVHSIEQ